MTLTGFCSTVRGAKRGEDLVLDTGDDMDWILDEAIEPVLSSPLGRRRAAPAPGEDVYDIKEEPMKDLKGKRVRIEGLPILGAKSRGSRVTRGDLMDNPSIANSTSG